MTQGRPPKKTDRELWSLIPEKISHGDYVFVKHSKQRQKERNITDIDVLNILENKKGHKRKRNKIKDKYEEKHEDWNYCIEGNDLDGDKIRIIITFDKNHMLIITVIRIAN